MSDYHEITLTVGQLRKASSFQFPSDHGMTSWEEAAALANGGLRTLNQWCRCECKKNWYSEHFQNIYIFSFLDADDAMLFKLTWS